MLLAAGGCSGDAPDRPNLLLVTVDTLRADHLGSYGYSKGTSPSIDGVGDEGVRFARLMAPRGLTWPSIATLMTGRHPRSHGIRENGSQFSETPAPLARVLHDSGYATAAFVTNMLTTPHPGFGEVGRFRGRRRDVAATDELLAWLEEGPPRPFFAWIHYFGPHQPYSPPAEYAERFATGYAGELDGTTRSLFPIVLERRELAKEQLDHVVSLYDGEIAHVDTLVGRVLARLDALDLAERTLVVFTADHGEELFQRRHYFFHHCSIYDSVLHVPLVMRLPGVLPAGRVVESLAESADVAPTLYELLGVDKPRGVEGESLVARMRGEVDGADDGQAFAELEGSIYSVRTGRWRYVENPRGHAPQGPPYRFADDERRHGYRIAPVELYDHAADPLELHDVSAAEPEVVRRLSKLLEEWKARHPEAPPGPAPSPETRAELRALGYVD